MTALALTCSLLFCFSEPADQAISPPTDEQVRAAAQRSLPVIEKGAVEWKDNKKCVTCHRVAMGLWAEHDAKRHGLTVNDPVVEQLSDFALEFCATNKNKDLPTGGFLLTMNQMILSRKNAPSGDAVRDEKALKTFEIFIPIMARMQRPDGSWAEGNQIKRPGAEDEAAQVDTMWTLWALSALKPMAASFSEESRATLTKIQEQARKWLKDAKPGVRTDWLMMRMLLAHADQRTDDVAAIRQELLGRQNADGGWYFLKDEGSHPHVTGEMLYALRTSGLEASHPAIQKARQYLLATQGEDGGWQAASRRSPPKTYDITNYWATCWAAIGLAGTLPD